MTDLDDFLDQWNRDTSRARDAYDRATKCAACGAIKQIGCKKCDACRERDKRAHDNKTARHPKRAERGAEE